MCAQYGAHEQLQFAAFANVAIVRISRINGIGSKRGNNGVAGNLRRYARTSRDQRSRT